jgi:hypothetical protein
MATAPSTPNLIELEGASEWDAAQAYFEERGWTDGLPIVPPTRERVEAMYRFTDRSPRDVVATLPPRHGQATIERVATNAVMAGCRPEFFPVVVAVAEALGEEERLMSFQTTTNPLTLLTVVNGPIARELDINGGNNCLGQGWRANATIGRAVRLMLLNIGGGIPGSGDKATQGTAAKFTSCIAENEADSPWQPFHVDKGFAPDDSVVSLHRFSGPANIQDHDSESALGVLTTFALALKGIVWFSWKTHRSHPLFLMGPEHAATLARGGYTKDDVKRYLWEHAHVPVSETSPDWQANQYYDELLEETGQREVIPPAPHWSAIQIVVAGGPGLHSSWCPGSDPVLRRIERKDGTPVRSVHDFV